MANININEELIRAVEEQDLKKVKALLAAGGTVLFRETYNGDTALHRTRKKEIAKKLLLRGADVHATNNYKETPKDRIAKLAIKFNILNKFSLYISINDIHKDPDTVTRSAYDELSTYLNNCLEELLRMTRDEKFAGHSLYEIITKKIQNNFVYKNISQTDFSERYPIYNDIILDMVKERKDILDKLNGIQIYTNVDAPSEDVKGKKIILDYYSTYNICQYLSNDDLLNLMDIFEDLQVPLRNNHNEELNENLKEEVDETLPTHDSKLASIE